MRRYLLDTNTLSDLVRNPHGAVAARIRLIGEAQIATSIIVASELRYGAAKKGSPRLSAQVDAILAALEVLPFDQPADAEYARLRAKLERAGQPLGAHDMLIAAHALTLGYTVVTANERDFARVEGLRVDNWLA